MCDTLAHVRAVTCITRMRGSKHDVYVAVCLHAVCETCEFLGLLLVLFAVKTMAHIISSTHSPSQALVVLGLIPARSTMPKIRAPNMRKASAKSKAKSKKQSGIPQEGSKIFWCRPPEATRCCARPLRDSWRSPRT